MTDYEALSSTEHTVCFCFEVSYGEIEELVRAGKCKTIGDVQEQTCASSACGKCAVDIREILKKDA